MVNRPLPRRLRHFRKWARLVQVRRHKDKLVQDRKGLARLHLPQDSDRASFRRRIRLRVRCSRTRR